MSSRTVHKNQFRGSRPLHYHYTTRAPLCQRQFGHFFLYASSGKQRSFMIHGSTILARSKHGRLYGGCPPCLLYYTHLGKSLGGAHPGGVVAQSWQKLRSYELRCFYFIMFTIIDILCLKTNLIYSSEPIGHAGIFPLCKSFKPSFAASSIKNR